MANKRAYPGLPPPLGQEVAALEKRYSHVRYDAGDRVVILEAVDLPTGFTPSVITVRVEVPRGFPRSSPRVVLPWHLRYKGRVPRRLLNSGRYLVRGTLGDPILFWPDWDQSDTLTDVVGQVLTDLARISDADCPATTNHETASVSWNARWPASRED